MTMMKDEAEAAFHGFTLPEVQRAIEAIRRKRWPRLARLESEQLVWGDLCRRAKCATPCPGTSALGWRARV